MNKRDFLKGTVATVTAIAVPSAPVLADTPTFTVYNKIGLPVEISWEIYRDMVMVYKVDLATYFKEHYGTNFSIEKKKLEYCFDFRLNSNDPRDPSYRMLEAYENGHNNGWFIRYKDLNETKRNKFDRGKLMTGKFWEEDGWMKIEKFDWEV